MKISYKIALLLTLIGFIVIILYYSSSKVNNTETNNPTQSTKSLQSVNVVVNNVELVMNNELGEIKSKLVANKLKHNAKTTLTELNNPTLIINQNDSTWQIIADTGLIIHNKIKVKEIEEIILSNHVKITRLNYNNTKMPFLNLETNKISYFPNKDLVSSDQHVIITTQDSITTATGLKFNKSDQKLQLLSNVVTKYQTSNLANNK